MLEQFKLMVRGRDDQLAAAVVILSLNEMSRWMAHAAVYAAGCTCCR